MGGESYVETWIGGHVDVTKVAKGVRSSICAFDPVARNPTKRECCSADLGLIPFLEQKGNATEAPVFLTALAMSPSLTNAGRLKFWGLHVREVAGHVIGRHLRSRNQPLSRVPWGKKGKTQPLME